jgi:ribulose-5-phosphate 4-epimerase/fuculose-1-phosphate aldolase
MTDLRDTIDAAKRDLAASLRLAAHYGLNEGVCNHFSYAVPGLEDRFLLNPHGIHWSRIRASDILLIDGAGRTIEGEGEAELTAFTIHGRIHANNARARCVLHTHMPYATTLACLEDGKLEPIHQNALRFHDDVAYDPDYNGLAEDAEEGDRIAAALGDRKVLFMANHGVVVVGETIAQAFDDLYYLERACQVQVLALSTGRPLKRVGDNRAAETRAEYDRGGAYYDAHFNAMKRLLDPDYAS